MTSTGPEKTFAELDIPVLRHRTVEDKGECVALHFADNYGREPANADREFVIRLRDWLTGWLEKEVQ